MKKGLVIGLVAVLVLLAVVPAAMALTESQREELKGLYREQHVLRQRILDKKTEFGMIDPEDAQKIRERMQERWEIRQQQMEDGEFSFGPGKMGRRGWFGRMDRGGCGNCPRPSGFQNGPEL